MRLISVAFLLLFVSCKKDVPEEVLVSEVLSNGTVVLCEGLFQQNNSTLSWINKEDASVSNTLFETKVGRQLGDTGNDIKRYGNKVYVVVNISSTIEVLDASSFQSIKQISMQSGGVAKQPRNIEFYNGNAYVTCYDGYVDVIDTASLTITARIPVGLNPEDLTVSLNKLYVSNSGGLNTPSMDSTVSVIDLTTNTEIERITVGLNPGRCITDSEGDVYVVTRGDYGAIPSRMVRINTITDVVVDHFGYDVTGITKMNNKFLISYYDFSTTQSSIGLFDPVSDVLENSSYLDVTGYTTLYGVAFNPHTNTIFVSDAMAFTNSGYVYEYTTSGAQIANYHVGLNPSKFLFYE